MKDKFRESNKCEVDSDFIKGHRLTNNESSTLIFQDIAFDDKKFKEAIEQYVKWK